MWFNWLGIFYSTQKSFYNFGINFDNFVGYVPMSFIMCILKCFFVGSIYQAKTCMPIIIKPVSDKFAIMLILNFQIFLMRIGNPLPSCIFGIVTIHINRHGGIPFHQ